MPIAKVISFFAPGVATVSGGLPTLLSTEDVQALEAGAAKLVAQGVPAELAAQVARSDAMYAVLDIVEMAHEMKRDVKLAAELYFALVGRLGLRWVSAQVTALPFESHWQAMARAAMRDDLANLQRGLTESVLRLSPSLDRRDALLDAWEAHHAKALARMREVMADLKGARETDLAMLSVLLRELRVLA